MENRLHYEPVTTGTPPTVSKAVLEFAEKFGVEITVDKHGIYGDEWDWVARPLKPTWYPNVKVVFMSVLTDPKAAIRNVAEQMGTGKWYGSRFCQM